VHYICKAYQHQLLTSLPIHGAVRIDHTGAQRYNRPADHGKDNNKEYH